MSVWMLIAAAWIAAGVAGAAALLAWVYIGDWLLGIRPTLRLRRGQMIRQVDGFIVFEGTLSNDDKERLAELHRRGRLMAPPGRRKPHLSGAVPIGDGPSPGNPGQEWEGGDRS